jgi:signal transduction histidine kinase/ActR/RegA family two-component response regulator
MVHQASTKELVILVQTNNKNLEHLLMNLVTGENIRIDTVESSSDLDEQIQKDQIITFVIGSDIPNPIQSAQRLYKLNKSAKIVLLSKSKKTEALKESIKFTPFIGRDVHCLEESEEEVLDTKLNEIIQNSRIAEQYRTIIKESNSGFSLKSSVQETVYNPGFINKLMDIAPIGIAIVEQNGKILGWNKEAALIFNRSESHVMGTPLPQLFGQLQGIQLEHYFREKYENRESGPIEPLLLERESQEMFKKVLSISAAPFTFSGGNQKALILVIKDETERIQAEKVLQEMNETLEKRVKERTASLLSYQHQLRSLASQLSMAEEKERHRIAAELHDHLGQMLVISKMKISYLQQDQLPEEMAESIEDVKKWLDDALAFTRDLMSDLKPPPSIDRENIMESMEWLASQMEKHDLNVTIEDDKQPKPVNEEIRITLVQCVRELLFNIIKHAGVNEARIKLSRFGQEAKIVVEDKGQGFNFEPDRVISLEGGFGLFNVTERIDLLGGSIDIESEPGNGTTTTLRVPISVETSREQHPGDEKADDQPGIGSKTDKVKVMLVDDHKMMREGLRKIVDEQDDLKVIAEASNGEESIEVAEKMSPDIVVMDVNMPVMDGISATRKLMEKMPNVRVIGLSFHNHQKVVDSMRSAGATAYLSKNEAFETLSATIRSEAKLARL